MRADLEHRQIALRVLLLLVTTPAALAMAALLVFLGVPTYTGCFLARCSSRTMQGLLVGGSLIALAAMCTAVPCALLAVVTGRRGWLWVGALVAVACLAYGLTREPVPVTPA